MKKIVLSLTMLLATGLSGFAYDLVVNNGDTAFFYYTITSEEEQTVELSKDSLVQTYKPRVGSTLRPWPMHVDIPETVTIDSKEYTVTALGDKVFRNYQHLADITFPKTLKTIGKSAFASTSNMKVYVEDLEAWLRIERKWPVYMTDFALYDKSGNLISDVVIPETETEIANWKFMGVTGINKVTIPSSVKSVGIRAFKGSSVVEIDMADVETIGKEAFWECEKLEKLSFGNSLTEIPDECCTGLKKLNTVTMGNNVKTIGAKAFYDCSNLGKVVLSSSLEEIGVAAFYSCTGLKNINTVDALTTIGGSAFYNCPAMTNVPFGSGLKTLGSYAFNQCESLTSVIIPAGVTVIEPKTFQQCTSLAEIVIGDGVTEIGADAFYYCQKLTSLTLGNSVKVIGDNAFKGCYTYMNPDYITSLTIPNSVEEIGSEAFFGWYGLDSLTIGSGVKTIADKAFSCNKGQSNSVSSRITSVTCLGKTPAKINNDTFDTTTYAEATLTVPEGTRRAYKKANIWSLFANITDGTPDNGDDDEDERADVNQDGEINSADVVYIYNRIIYGKGNEE